MGRDMTDERDINALRHYVARLEEDLASADLEIEGLRKYSSKQALDIVTLGQEVGRLREALKHYACNCAEGKCESSDVDSFTCGSRARAALAKKEEK